MSPENEKIMRRLIEQREAMNGIKKVRERVIRELLEMREKEKIDKEELAAKMKEAQNGLAQVQQLKESENNELSSDSRPDSRKVGEGR